MRKGCTPPGHLHEYQKKGDAGGGVCKNNKGKEIEKWCEASLVRIELAYTSLHSLD